MIAPILGAALLVAALPGSARAAVGSTVASSTAALRYSGPPPDTIAAHPTWRWGAGPRLSLLQLRDDLLAPLRYTGPALGGRIFLERATAAGEDRLDLRVGAGIGFNRMGHGAASLPWGASVAVLRRVAGSTGVAASSAAASTTTARSATERAATARQLLLGAVLLVQADAVYFYDWDDAHLAHDLTRRARLRYDLSFRTTSLPRRAAALAHEVGVEWTIGGAR